MDDVTTVARLARDLRYWTARRRSAEVIPAAAENSIVRFGTAVTLQRNDGTEITYRIVGEDEAAPADGRISYVSPWPRRCLAGRLAISSTSAAARPRSCASATEIPCRNGAAARTI